MTERRRDPLTGEWRTFASDRDHVPTLPPEHCTLCPTRDPLTPTEVPWDAYEIVVLDDHLSLATSPAQPVASTGGSALFEVEPDLGATEIVVYTDDHSATLPSLGVERVRLLVDVWADRYAALGARDEIAYVLVSEDRRAYGSGTQSHPHGRVLALAEVPTLPAQELLAARRHLDQLGTCVLCDVVARESADGVRIVATIGSVVAYVPFAARHPYEVHVATTRHVASLLDLSDLERDALASALVTVIGRFDALFGSASPYGMAVHQAPTSEEHWQEVSHLHVEVSPGSTAVGDAARNDVAPEEAAATLRGDERSNAPRRSRPG